MRLAASLYLGLLYVLPSFSILAAESRGQRELLTYQHPQDFGQRAFSRLDEITIDELQSLFSDGTLTSEILVNAYIQRTWEVNSVLHAVGEINPDALAIARSLDAERAAGSVRGPLHGVPILVKDNIATYDKMNNTSGSYALLGATVSRDSPVVSKLRDAGAVILGKATMGEWAQCRSRQASSSHGWSAYGGQVYGAYYPHQDPSGSSSGSAVAVSVGLALGSLATETSGSIVLPGERSNIVGIKPTLGLTSRNMVIPISLRQDSVGPMARTVKDAAYMLSAFAGKDKYDNWTLAQPFEKAPDYAKACTFSGLKGARVGVPRNGIDYYLDESTAPVMAAFEEALQIIISAGASVLDKANFANFDPPAFHGNSSIVLDTDFVAGLTDYLSQLVQNPNKIHNLYDVSQYTKSDPREEYPNRDTYVWDRQSTRNITNASPESWQAYQVNLHMAEEMGVLGALDRYNLDALVMPTFTSFHLPAIAGLPIITVPLGFYPTGTATTMNKKGTMVQVGPGVPFGLAFVGRRWSEETLISLAYAFEQRTLVRKRMKPLVSPSFELGHRSRPAMGDLDAHRAQHISMQETMAQPTIKPSTSRSSVRRWTRSWLGLVRALRFLWLSMSVGRFYDLASAWDTLVAVASEVFPAFIHRQTNDHGSTHGLMKSGNQFRDKSLSNSAKASDPGTPSTALQGATLAFNSCATSSNSSRSKHSGINGALAAASFAGGGRKRVTRRTTFETIPANDLRRPVGDSGPGQIGQQVSASNGPIKRTAPSLSREQSPSHIAAVMAATSSSPMPESLGLPRSNPRRPSPLQRAHSELSIRGRLTDVTPIAATNTLIQLYERGKTRSRTPSFHEAHPVRSPAPSLASPTPIRPLSGRLSLQSTMPPDPPKPPTRKRGSTTLGNTNSSSVGAHAAARIAARPVQPLAIRSQTPVSLEGPAPKPPTIRGYPKRPALPLERDNTMSSSPDRSTASSSESSYTSAVDKFPSPLKELPRRREPRSASESISTSSALARPSIRPQRLSYEPERKPLVTREPTLSTTSLIPQLTADSLANAMVASSLASSRAPSPTKPHLPPPHRHSKPHHLFHRTKSSDQISRTPSPAKQMKQTLRPSKTYEGEETLYKKGRTHIIRKHPNKHHEGDRKRWRDIVSEAERKRYEGLWAANKNLLLPPRDPPSDTVCDIVVRDIWRRSRLPDDILAEVWELVDTRQGNDLGKEGFVVGMWLIDQRLKGRKLPVRVSESVWGSVRMLSGIKVHRHRR